MADARSEPLWRWHDLVRASIGRAEAAPGRALPDCVTGVSIDTRTIEPGDLFVALKDGRDGHEFVGQAFEKGAAAALVADGYSRGPRDGALIRVADPLQALELIGIAARARLSPEARVIAVTGSVGKTTTKEMLRACLSSQGATHASEKSYNNHWGVPLTLARMPAATRFGVFEIGMNHAGEITPLTRMVRPHVAIITTVGPVHLEFFGTVDAIAEAKAEIFLGLEAPSVVHSTTSPSVASPSPLVGEGRGGGDGGAQTAVAVVNADIPQTGLLRRRAEAAGARILTFGSGTGCDLRLTGYATERADAEFRDGSRMSFTLGIPGRHAAENALAVLLVVGAVGGDIEKARQVLPQISAQAGRGARTEHKVNGSRVVVIDESYNANPTSMAAAIHTLGASVSGQRKIAILGDMRELGEASDELHRGLLAPIMQAGVDRVFLCGPHMKALYESVPQSERNAWTWAPASTDLIAPVLAEVRAGDVVMIKGSLGTRMAPILDALKAKLSAT